MQWNVSRETPPYTKATPDENGWYRESKQFPYNHLVVFCLDVCSWLDVKGLWHVFMSHTNCIQQCIDWYETECKNRAIVYVIQINCFRVFCECIDEMICIDRELLNTPSVRGRMYFWSSMFSFSIFRYRFRRVLRLSRSEFLRLAIWLILPVVIRSSQRLSHACLSISNLYSETANCSLYQL